MADSYNISSVPVPYNGPDYHWSDPINSFLTAYGTRKQAEIDAETKQKTAMIQALAQRGRVPLGMEDQFSKEPVSGSDALNYWKAKQAQYNYENPMDAMVISAGKQALGDSYLLPPQAGGLQIRTPSEIYNNVNALRGQTRKGTGALSGLKTSDIPSGLKDWYQVKKWIMQNHRQATDADAEQWLLENAEVQE